MKRVMRLGVAGVCACLVLAGSAQAQFVSDTFTDTATTLLASHTGETGATWTNHPQAEATDWQISDVNRLRGNATSGGTGYFAYASGIPPDADYEVEAILFVKSLQNLAGVLGRLDTTAYSGYEATYVHEGVNAWRLGRRDTGTFVQLGSTFPQTLVDETAYTVTLEMIGSSIKLYVDGVERISATDTTYTTAGRAGVYIWGTQVTPSNTASLHVDFVSATDITVAGGARLTLLGAGK